MTNTRTFAPTPRLARPVRVSRVLAAIAAALAVAAAGLVAAPAASATSYSYTVDCTQVASPINFLTMSPGDTISAITTANTYCDELDVVANASDISINGSPASVGSNALASNGAQTITFTAPQAAGSQLFSIRDSANIFMGKIWNITLTGGGGGGGGGGSSDPATSSESVAVPATMSLALGDNAACAGGSPTGTTGEWMTLPGSGDCHNTAAPSAALLGWATSPDFPVAIAQRQSANHWGAYQMANEAGEITAVFIPAGWATFVSGSTNLYPVWSK